MPVPPRQQVHGVLNGCANEDAQDATKDQSKEQPSEKGGAVAAVAHDFFSTTVCWGFAVFSHTMQKW